MHFPYAETIQKYIQLKFQSDIEKNVERPVTIDVTREDNVGYRCVIKVRLSQEELYQIQHTSYLDCQYDKVDGGEYDYQIARFYLTELPGCCGVCVSFGAYIAISFRKKGLGTLLNKVRQHIAYEYGYTCFLCTDIDTNEPQKKILSAEGFDTVFDFTNARTGNRVNISCLDLREKHG